MASLRLNHPALRVNHAEDPVRGAERAPNGLEGRPGNLSVIISVTSAKKGVQSIRGFSIHTIHLKLVVFYIK